MKGPPAGRKVGQPLSFGGKPEPALAVQAQRTHREPAEVEDLARLQVGVDAQQLAVLRADDHAAVVQGLRHVRGPSGDALVGGLYGLAMGGAFFGESMFSAESGGSKVALAGLAHRMRQWGWPLIDAQVENPHLVSLGARLMRRDRFLSQVQALTALPAPAGPWTQQFGVLSAAELAC